MENTETVKGISTSVSGMKHGDNFYSMRIKVTFQNDRQFVNTSADFIPGRLQHADFIPGRLQHEVTYFGLAVQDMYELAKKIIEYANASAHQEAAKADK